MNELVKLTITEIKEGLSAGKFTSTELVNAYFDQIEKNKHLNAYITLTKKEALAQAAKADENIKAGKARLLEGVPIALKDLFCTKDIKTTAASKILENFVPPYESTVSQNLIDDGAVILGKTNMDEFAMGSATTYSHFGATVSPITRNSDSEDLVAGGSSGGSASAVAGFLCAAATGSDTGGSVRQPAAFTGIVGVKPTYGRCSRYGMVAFASSLDQAGAMARSVDDAAIMLESMASFDEKDSTSAKVEEVNFFSELQKADLNLKGLKVGIPKEYQTDDTPQEIIDVWNEGKKWLEAKGASIVEITLPNTKYAAPTYYVIAPAEASANLSRYDGVRYGYRTKEEVSSIGELYTKTRSEGFGEEVKRRILTGTFVLSSGSYEAYYKKALKVRNKIANDFVEAFKDIDVILTPTTPNSAFEVNKKFDNPIAKYIADIFTVPVNLAGLPAISVPAGFDKNGLPLGLQIIANHFSENTMFRVAKSLEEEAKFLSSNLNYNLIS